MKKRIDGKEKTFGWCTDSGKWEGYMTSAQCKAYADRTSGVSWYGEISDANSPTGCYVQFSGSKIFIAFNSKGGLSCSHNIPELDQRWKRCKKDYRYNKDGEKEYYTTCDPKPKSMKDKKACICNYNHGDVLWYYPSGCFTQTFGGRKVVRWNSAYRSNGEAFDCKGHYDNAKCLCADRKTSFPTGCYVDPSTKKVGWNSSKDVFNEPYSCGGAYGKKCLCRTSHRKYETEVELQPLENFFKSKKDLVNNDKLPIVKRSSVENKKCSKKCVAKMCQNGFVDHEGVCRDDIKQRFDELKNYHNNHCSSNPVQLASSTATSWHAPQKNQ